MGVLCAVLAGCTVPASNVVEVAAPEREPKPELAPEAHVPVAVPPELPAWPSPLPPAGPPQALPRAPLLQAPRAEPRSTADVVVKEPVIRQRRYPTYPSALVEQGVVGLVVTSFFVGVDGRPEEITVERSSHPLLSRAATDSLKEWRFDPARTADGRAVRARMRLPFRFQLE